MGLRIVFLALALATAGAALATISGRCWTAWYRWDLSLKECPQGNPLVRLAATTSNLRRGEEGTISIQAMALFAVGPLHSRQGAIKSPWLTRSSRGGSRSHPTRPRDIARPCPSPSPSPK